MRAFYGILFRHDDHSAPGSLRSAAGRRGGRRRRGGARDAERAEVLEEASRLPMPATPRPSGRARERELRRRRSRRSRARRSARSERIGKWRGPAAVGIPAVHDHRIALSPGARPARAAAPRAAAAVAEAPLAVHDRELDVARERVVLQPVVAHEHVTSGCASRSARAAAAGRRDVHRHARAPRDEHGSSPKCSGVATSGRRARRPGDRCSRGHAP
jgi:hypothetical protein